MPVIDEKKLKSEEFGTKKGCWEDQEAEVRENYVQKVEEEQAQGNNGLYPALPSNTSGI